MGILGDTEMGEGNLEWLSPNMDIYPLLLGYPQ